MNEKSLNLLEQYEIEVTGTRRGRGSYICETSLGKMLFSDYSGSEKKLEFVNRVLEHMETKGYAFADKVMANREGKLVTRDWDESTYILKDWYEGRECDTRSQGDIEQAVSNLARLHKIMVCPEEMEEECGYFGEDLCEAWQRHNQELRKVFSFAGKRKQKTPFESLFLSCYTLFSGQARDALENLENSGYRELYDESRRKGCLCHGNYNQHNVYFPGRRQIFTANFDRCCYDIQVVDLYQFLRKIMEKQDWSEQTGHRILEIYDQERGLSDQELSYLRLRLWYPEKFWKLANQYYNSRKSCISWKNAEKLEKLFGQQKQRIKFLKTLE